ncbi:hypothetical protein C8Q78DRAFT_1057389 [Trametes maxima]|nr:hypothetical protein C8Q78DRAFT_1057389 [Trametes maxima]
MKSSNVPEGVKHDLSEYSTVCARSCSIGMCVSSLFPLPVPCTSSNMCGSCLSAPVPKPICCASFQYLVQSISLEGVGSRTGISISATPAGLYRAA